MKVSKVEHITVELRFWDIAIYLVDIQKKCKFTTLKEITLTNL